MSRYQPKMIEAKNIITSMEQPFDLQSAIASCEQFEALTQLQHNVRCLGGCATRSELLSINSFMGILSVPKNALNLSLESIRLTNELDLEVSLEGIGEKIKSVIKTVISKIIGFFKWMVGKVKDLFNRNEKAKASVKKANGHGAEVAKKTYQSYKTTVAKLEHSPNKEVSAAVKEADTLATQGKVKEAKEKIREVAGKLKDDKSQTERAKEGEEVNGFIKDQGEHGNTSVVSDLNRILNLLNATPNPKTQSMSVVLNSKNYAGFINNIKDIQPVCAVGNALSNHCRVIPTLTKDMVAGLNLKYDRSKSREERQDISIVQAKVAKEFSSQLMALQGNAELKNYFDVSFEKGDIPRVSIRPKSEPEMTKIQVNLGEMDKYLPMISKALDDIGNGLKLASTAGAFASQLNEFLESASKGDNPDIQMQAKFLTAYMIYCSSLGQATMRLNNALSSFALETTTYINMHLN